MKTIEVSEIQKLISEFKEQASERRDSGNLQEICHAMGIESVVKALEELIEAEK